MAETAGKVRVPPGMRSAAAHASYGSRHITRAWVVLGTLVVACLPGYDTSTEPLTGQDVCRDYEPFTKGACTIDADGVQRGTCQRCLVGPKWNALRERLGTVRSAGVARRTKPVLSLDNWASSALQTTAFRIILQELLGFDEVVVIQNSFGVSNVLAQALSEDCQAVHLEVWNLIERYQEAINEAGDALTVMPLGTRATEGFYVPEYMPFTSRHYLGLQTNAVLEVLEDGTEIRTLDSFPPDGTLGPANISSWAQPPDFFCTEKQLQELQWTNSTCVQGRWYPPQCGSEYPSKQCHELYLAAIQWSRGWWESVVKNLNLNFSVVYAGYSGLKEIVEKSYKERWGILYYWWEPDPLHILFPSKRVELPSFSDSCLDSWAWDPLESGVNCDMKSTNLQKVAPTRLLESEPDLGHLFKLWRMDKDQMLEMMSFHVSGGGEYDIEEAACAFLKAETAVPWQTWLQVTAAGKHNTPDDGAKPPRRIALISLSSVLVVGLFFLGIWMVKRSFKSQAFHDLERRTDGSGPQSTLNTRQNLSADNSTGPEAGKARVMDHAEANQREFTTSLWDCSQNSYGQKVETQTPLYRNGKQTMQVQVMGVIGSGATARVFKGLWHGVPVAMKVCILKANDNQKDPESLFAMEGALQESLRHPNIVQVFGFEVMKVKHEICSQIKSSAGVQAFDEMVEDPEPSWEARIIQEYCSHGNLRQNLKSGMLEGQSMIEPQKPCPPSIATSLTLLLDVAAGLAFIHASNIIHGDLKSANVLLTNRDDNNKTKETQFMAKIADFGLAKQMDPQATHLSGVYSGTLTHLAPEALQFGRQSKAADVYAFGMVMYELFSARRPYDKMSSTAILEAICYKGQRPVLPATVPVKIVELYDQCTAFVPDNRPVAEEVVMMVSKLLLEHAKDPLIAARGTHRHRVVKRPSEIISPHSKQFTPDNANSHMKVTSMTLRFPSSTWLTIALPWFFQMGAFCEVEDSLDSGSDSATQIFRMGDECGTAHPMPSPLVSLRMQPATGNRRGPSRSSSCSNLGNAIGERVSRASSWLTLSSGRGADVEVDAALHSSEEGHRQVMNMHG